MSFANRGGMTYLLRTFTLSLAAVAAVFATSEQATAGPIIFFLDVRELATGGEDISERDSGSFTESRTHEPDGRWGYGTASQDTIRTQSFIGGTGTATVQRDGVEGALAYSTISIGFRIDQPYFADLALELSVLVHGVSYIGVWADAETGAHTLWEESIRDGTMSIVRQAVLQPGSYLFQVGSFASLTGDYSGSATSSFAGGLTLAPVPENPTAVPEPATMMLMGTGLLVAYKKKRHHA